MQLSIKTDFSGIQKKLNQLKSDIGNKAMASALNKTVAIAKTDMSREIRREFKVSASYVRERLAITKATTRRGLNFTASLRGTGKRSANIINFVERSISLAQARKRGKGGTLNQLRVQIKRGGGKKALAGAFIGNKGRTVFQRIPGTVAPGRSKYAGTKYAERIKAVRTIDIKQMFNTRRINAKVTKTIHKRFPEIFDREAQFYTNKFNQR